MSSAGNSGEEIAKHGQRGSRRGKRWRPLPGACTCPEIKVVRGVNEIVNIKVGISDFRESNPSLRLQASFPPSLARISSVASSPAFSCFGEIARSSQTLEDC